MKDIPGYEGRYAITEDGKVWSHRKKIFRKTSIINTGYETVSLTSGKGKHKWERIHRIMATVFLKKEQHHTIVNHKNGIKTDNRVENLEWTTQSGNIKHSYDFLGRKGHKKNSKQVLQLDINGLVLNTYESATNASLILGLHKSYISLIIKNKTFFRGGFWYYKKNICTIGK